MKITNYFDKKRIQNDLDFEQPRPLNLRLPTQREFEDFERHGASFPNFMITECLSEDSIRVHAIYIGESIRHKMPFFARLLEVNHKEGETDILSSFFNLNIRDRNHV